MKLIRATITGENLSPLAQMVENGLEYSTAGNYYNYRKRDLYLFGVESYSFTNSRIITTFIVLDFVDPGRCKVEITATGQDILSITSAIFGKGSGVANYVKWLEKQCESRGWHFTTDLGLTDEWTGPSSPHEPA